ncbi:MAG: hypothetical protein QOD32_907 [Pyrinomonadaceae bacterium]|jgi:hypothetical protein|nr:hypothetical protein [Pyrinomonadaceae bacterium]
MPPSLRRLCTLVVISFCALAGLPTTAARAGQNPEAAAIVRTTPAETLRTAQTIFIRTKSAYFKPAALEQALLDRSEVQYWGLVISRDEADADLVIEVDRKLFTNIFVYSVLDPRANRVLISGKIGSLGGTVEGQIASGFVKRLRPFRALNSPVQTK